MLHLASAAGLLASEKKPCLDLDQILAATGGWGTVQARHSAHGEVDPQKQMVQDLAAAVYQAIDEADLARMERDGRGPAEDLVTIRPSAEPRPPEMLKPWAARLEMQLSPWPCCCAPYAQTVPQLDPGAWRRQGPGPSGSKQL